VSGGYFGGRFGIRAVFCAIALMLVGAAVNSRGHARKAAHAAGPREIRRAGDRETSPH